MNREELREKLLKLSKPSIVAGFEAVLNFYPEEVYRAALMAEQKLERTKRRAASDKALEYSKLAEQRYIKGKGGAHAALAASEKAHKESATHSRRCDRLHKELMATFED